MKLGTRLLVMVVSASTGESAILSHTNWSGERMTSLLHNQILTKVIEKVWCIEDLLSRLGDLSSSLLGRGGASR